MTGQPIATRLVTPRTRPWSAILWRGERWASIAVAFFAALAIGYKPLLYLSDGNAPWVASFYQAITLSATDVGLALIVLIGWMSGRGKEVTPTTPATWFAVGAGVVLLICLVASTTVALVPRLSLLCAVRVGLGLLAAVTIARRPRFARAILAGGAVLLLIELPIVLLQIGTQSTFPTGRLLDGWAGEATAASPGAAVVIGPDGSRWLRAAGTLPHPNILGAFAALALVCALPWFMRGGQRRIPLLIVGIALWLALLLSFSRGAWLAAALGGGLWGLGQLRRISRRRLLWLAVPPLVALALGLLIAGATLRDRIVPSATEPATIQRLLIGVVAVDMISHHPLRGVGAGNFVLAEIPPPYNAVSVEPVHFMPLLVGAEAGILAGIAWLALFIGPVLAEVWQRRRIAVARLALPTAVLTLGSFDHYFWTFASGQALFWLGLGVWLAGGGLGPEPGEPERFSGATGEGGSARGVKPWAGWPAGRVRPRGLGSPQTDSLAVQATPPHLAGPPRWIAGRAPRRGLQPGLQSNGSAHAGQAIAPED